MNILYVRVCHSRRVTLSIEYMRCDRAPRVEILGDSPSLRTTLLCDAVQFVHRQTGEVPKLDMLRIRTLVLQVKFNQNFVTGFMRPNLPRLNRQST